MIREYRAASLLCLTALLAAVAATAQQSVQLQSVRGADTRVLIAVPPCAAETPDAAGAAQEMANVLSYDLDFSGLFLILPREQYPAGFTGLDPNVNRLDLDAWRGTKAEHLVFGAIKKEGDLYVGQFRLFDLYAKEQVVGQELRVQASHPRLAAHRFSEEIIRFLDGTPGIGTSEIVFSGGSTGKKEIYVADYDGANVRKVTDHGSISIKPKISPDGNRFAYLSYKDRYSFLYVFDRRTGAATPLSKEVGLNSSPAWTPDGNRLAMTLSKDGNTEIYLRDPDGKNPVRLTKNKDGDTSPTFSPDGGQIAFVSDRGGNPQIYVMGADGGNARRLSYQGGNSYDPVWSPDGKAIAYTVESRGEGFEIYVMDADGANPRRVTNSQGSNESPSWSPDCRHIMFCSSRNGRMELWTVTLKTGQERRVPGLDMACEGPSWGPRRR